VPGRDEGNRFTGSWVGSIRIPLPMSYVLGIDLDQGVLDRAQTAYLRGQWRTEGGWWYYYLYALAIKVPLGTWCLALLAAFCRVRFKEGSASWRDEVVLLAPAVVVLALFSAQTSLNKHFRYVLPIFPFLYVWMSQVARPAVLRRKGIACLAGLALAWSAGGSLWVYPHSLSYFNDLVGGPAGGPAHLLGSNVDYGQDLLYLKRWLDEHPEARPLGLRPRLPYDPRAVGIEYYEPPRGPRPAARRSDTVTQEGPLPGWYAVSVNEVYGFSRDYDYFRQFQPVARAGWSIYIYHITLDDANRVRGQLGLREISVAGL